MVNKYVEEITRRGDSMTEEDRWAIDWSDSGLDSHPNDKLIKKVLEFIEYTSDIEAVYNLMYHIPREALLDLVDEDEEDV